MKAFKAECCSGGISVWLWPRRLLRVRAELVSRAGRQDRCRSRCRSPPQLLCAGCCAWCLWRVFGLSAGFRLVLSWAFSSAVVMDGDVSLPSLFANFLLYNSRDVCGVVCKPWMASVWWGSGGHRVLFCKSRGRVRCERPAGQAGRSSGLAMVWPVLAVARGRCRDTDASACALPPNATGCHFSWRSCLWNTSGCCSLGCA